mgnify:CR=1 FL=1
MIKFIKNFGIYFVYLLAALSVVSLFLMSIFPDLFYLLFEIIFTISIFAYFASAFACKIDSGLTLTADILLFATFIIIRISLFLFLFSFFPYSGNLFLSLFLTGLFFYAAFIIRLVKYCKDKTLEKKKV